MCAHAITCIMVATEPLARALTIDHNLLASFGRVEPHHTPTEGERGRIIGERQEPPHAHTRPIANGRLEASSRGEVHPEDGICVTCGRSMCEHVVLVVLSAVG